MTDDGGSFINMGLLTFLSITVHIFPVWDVTSYKGQKPWQTCLQPFLSLEGSECMIYKFPF